MTVQHIEPGRLRTFEETRAQLRIGRSTLFRLIQAGDLKPIKIGRSLRFAEEDIAAFVAERRGD